MTLPPKQPKKAGSETLADKLKKKKAKDIGPLEKLMFQVCTWKPVDSSGAIRHISDIERAHLRTQKFLEHCTFKLVVKQAFFNLKKSIRETLLPKAKTEKG